MRDLKATDILCKSQPWLILGLGFTFLMIYAFPGFMSSDSAMQYLEAKSGGYSDWHPPAMAALWRLVNRIVDGPAGMLVLQAALFLIGSYRILRRDLSDRTAAFAAIAILLFPPVLAPMAVIWKDCQMAGFLLLGISFLLDPRRSRQCIGIGLITIATAMRTNAAASTLPLLVWLLAWHPKWWKRIAIATLIWIATVATAVSVNRLLTDRPKYLWYIAMGPADIVGTLKRAQNYTDSELIEIFDGAPLHVKTNIQAHARVIYQPGYWWHIVTDEKRLFYWPENETQRTAIARAWRTLIAENPIAFAQHRIRVFRAVLSLNDHPINDPVFRAHFDLSRPGDPNPYVSANGVQGDIADKLEWLSRNTVLFRPYLYFFFAVLLLAIARRHPDVMAILSSGLVYELALVIAAPSNDYRYSHWMILSTVIATMILFRRRYASRSTVNVAKP